MPEPVDDETKAITFADSGLDYRLTVDITETVYDENGPLYPQLVGQRDATPADLAAVLAQHPELLAAVLPSAEELAKRMYLVYTSPEMLTGHEPEEAWESAGPRTHQTWRNDARRALKALGVAE